MSRRAASIASVAVNPLHEKQIGALAASPIVVAPLFAEQEGSGSRPGHLHRGLAWEPASAPEQAVGRALGAPGGGAAQRPGHQLRRERATLCEGGFGERRSTALFAVISALVGFLFAAQRDAGGGSAARPAVHRRPAPSTTTAGERGRRGAARRCDPGPDGLRVLGLSLGEELSIHLSARTGLSRIGVRGRHPAGRGLAEHRDRSWRRACCSCDPCGPEPAEGHHGRDPLAAITPKEAARGVLPSGDRGCCAWRRPRPFC